MKEVIAGVEFNCATAKQGVLNLIQQTPQQRSDDGESIGFVSPTPSGGLTVVDNIWRMELYTPYG